MLRLKESFTIVFLWNKLNGHFWRFHNPTIFIWQLSLYYILDGLKSSKDETLAQIAEKSLKEARYHLHFSGEWVLRLGDGTEKAIISCQDSLNNLGNTMKNYSRPHLWSLMYGTKLCPNLNDVKDKAIGYARQKIKKMLHLFGQLNTSAELGKIRILLKPWIYILNSIHAEHIQAWIGKVWVTNKHTIYFDKNTLKYHGAESLALF